MSDIVVTLFPALRDLFKTMDKTAEGFPPIIFLQVSNKRFKCNSIQYVV